VKNFTSKPFEFELTNLTHGARPNTTSSFQGNEFSLVLKDNIYDMRPKKFKLRLFDSAFLIEILYRLQALLVLNQLSR